MAEIYEALTLVDKFSANFTKFIAQAEQAAAGAQRAQSSLDDIAQSSAATATGVGRLSAAMGETNNMLAAYASTSLQAQNATAQAVTGIYAYIRAQEEAKAAAEAAARAEAEAEKTRWKFLSATKASTSGMKSAASAADGLVGKLKNLAAAYLSVQGATKLIGLSDTLSQTSARLDRMNDGLQTTAELESQIMAAANRSRGLYTDMADMVGKLGSMAGEAFDSSAEIVAFAEQINKQMVLAGTSTQGMQAAMLQLTQAMSSGTLRGEELNSILEQAPTIAQTIAQYLGVSTGEMREMASQGQITAEVVKNAMFSAAEETNAAFEAMPLTWGQLWNQAQNIGIQALQPLLNMVAKIPAYIQENWPTIEPVFMAVAGGIAAMAIATGVATAAQWAMNSAMLASPITWIVVGIAAIILIIYKLVDAYNQWAGTSISAAGVVAGVFTTLFAHVANKVVIPLQNIFANFANMLGNVFNAPVDSISILFLDMATTVLGYIRAVAQGIEDLLNAIPGVSVSLTGAIDTAYKWVSGASQIMKDKSGWKEYVKAWDYIDYAEAYNVGYNWGSNLSSSFSGLSDLGSVADFGGYGGASAAEQLLESIDGSVGNIEKSVSMSEEDIKSLVDMAEREYINQINLTSQSPVIHVTGANTGNTAADRQSLADALAAMLVEQRAMGSIRSTARV